MLVFMLDAVAIYAPVQPFRPPLPRVNAKLRALHAFVIDHNERLSVLIVYVIILKSIVRDFTDLLRLYMGLGFPRARVFGLEAVDIPH